MQFQQLHTTTLALTPQTQWLWYSKASGGFVVGDTKVRPRITDEFALKNVPSLAMSF